MSKFYKILVFCFVCCVSTIASGQITDSKAVDSNITPKILDVLREEIYTLKGQVMPGFSKFVEKNTELGSETLRDKPTVLNIWFSSCAPCAEEIPILNKIQAQFSRRVNFIAVTFESQEEVAGFISKHDFDFHHVFDARDYINALGIVAYPKTIVFDKSSRIRSIMKKIPKSKSPEEKARNQEIFERKLVEEIDVVLDLEN